MQLLVGKTNSSLLTCSYLLGCILTYVWVALGKSLPEFVYFAVEICHCGPLPSATPSFLLWQKLCESAKHQKHCSAWVGQAEF